MDAWRLKWVVAGILGGLVLIGGHTFAYFGREASAAANFFSIAGWWLGFVGFTVTIYTMYQTQQVSREAQQKIEEAAARAEKAVRDAQEETRRVVQAIRREVLHSDHAILLMLLRGLRDAAGAGAWDAAVFCAEHAPRLTLRVAQVGGLPAEDAADLQNGAAELHAIHAYIRNNRVGRTAQGLPRSHVNTINHLIQRLEAIEALRLHDAFGGGQ